MYHFFPPKHDASLHAPKKAKQYDLGYTIYFVCLLILQQPKLSIQHNYLATDAYTVGLRYPLVRIFMVSFF